MRGRKDFVEHAARSVRQARVSRPAAHLGLMRGMDDYFSGGAVIALSPAGGPFYFAISRHLMAVPCAGPAGRGPRDARSMNDRGVCEYRAGFVKQAISSLRKAIALDPAHLESYLSLGAVYSFQGRRSDASSAYRAGLAAAPAGKELAVRALILSEMEQLGHGDRGP